MKLAVALIHGMGDQPPRFADVFVREVRRRLEKLSGADDVVFEPVHWAPVLEGPEEDLQAAMRRAGRLDWRGLRDFMVHFLADVTAYQITPHDRRVYDDVHEVVAHALKRLAQTAGPDAPLCVVAHSLGTVIASNYLYDLQQLPDRDIRPASVSAAMGDTPLERGETFEDLYTMASPLALFSLRYPDFGEPLRVPGRWLNLYDRDDVIAWPLKTLNAAYDAQVDEDRQVAVGSILTSPTPFSHTKYWNDRTVHAIVAQGLAFRLSLASGT